MHVHHSPSLSQKLTCQLGEGAAVWWSGVGRTGFSCVCSEWRRPGKRGPQGGWCVGYVMGRLESLPSTCGLQPGARDQTREPVVQSMPHHQFSHTLHHSDEPSACTLMIVIQVLALS